MTELIDVAYMSDRNVICLKWPENVFEMHVKVNLEPLPLNVCFILFSI